MPVRTGEVRQVVRTLRSVRAMRGVRTSAPLLNDTPPDDVAVVERRWSR